MLLEYKVLTLSLQMQRLLSIVGTVISASDGASLGQMKARLSEIDGLFGALPLNDMCEVKAREMIGDGRSPREHGSIPDLLNLRK